MSGEASARAEREAALLTRLRAGDDDAYATLVRENAGRMLAVARRIVRNEEDALDVVQESMVSAFKGLDSYKGNARISTWLHRIAVNHALMKLRSRRRRPEEPIEELLPSFLEDGHPEVPAAPWRDLSDEKIEREELRGLVRSSIDRLPERYRTVLMLRDIEEMDTGEVAELLGVSKNVVKTRLHRARQALRGLLDPELRVERP